MSFVRRKAHGRRVYDTKQPVIHLLKNSVYTTGLAIPACTATMPVTDLSTGRGVMDTQTFPKARVFFGGTTTAAQIINYQGILWYPFTVGPALKRYIWTPVRIAYGAATLGTLTMNALFESASGLMADTITDTGAATGTYAFSKSGNATAFLEISLRGSPLLEIQCELNDAVKADVFVQLGE